MLRRLAIAFLVLVTILMGALGWILGRPGVFRPEAQALAAPTGGTASLQAGSDLHGGGPSALNVHGAHGPHGDVHGE